jgi:hypothetical protein
MLCGNNELSSFFIGSILESTSVTLKWEGIPGNNYEVICSTDPEFKETASKYLTNTFHQKSNHSGFFYFLPLLLFMILMMKRKRIIYLPMIMMFVVLLSPQCKKSETPIPEVQLVEMTETIGGLLPDATYYWKIKAQKKNQNDFQSETLVRSFYTGDPATHNNK